MMPGVVGDGGGDGGLVGFGAVQGVGLERGVDACRGSAAAWASSKTQSRGDTASPPIHISAETSTIALCTYSPAFRRVRTTP